MARLFNGFGVPIAAMGIVHPAWAMGAMAASVSTELANSFGGRLLARTPKTVAEHTETAEAVRKGEASGQTTLRLTVPGMYCQGCVETIRAGVQMEQGVANVEGDADAKTVTVRFDEAAISDRQLTKAVARLGCTVRDAG